MQAIMIQLRHNLSKNHVKKNSIETLFIGGGTPSCVKASLYEPLFALLLPYLQEDAEITTEANPNSATKRWLDEMHALGVNRISFGVQSFHQKKLEFLNRNHTPTEAKSAIYHAKESGFCHISLDLIYGTSYDTKSLLTEDLKEAFSLPIDHLSAYSLTIEEHTHFFTTPNSANDNKNTTYWFVKEIQKYGLPQYEISNFGRYQSRHNKGYWQYKDYLGIGAGAVGFLEDRRFYTYNDVHAYIENPLYCSEEILSQEDIKNEKILLGLRSDVGFDKTLLSKREHQKAEELLDAQKLTYHDRRYFNPNFFLADALTLYITS